MAFDRPIGILTICCEASDQSDLCKQAIIASIRNRVAAGRWETTVAGVCMQRYQYSEYNDDAGDNRNLERVLALADDDPEILAAGAAYDATIDDPSLGATHFYAVGIPAPPWTIGATRTVQIGKVIFWKVGFIALTP